MSGPDSAAIIRRIDQLLGIQLPPGDQSGIYAAIMEAVHGATTVSSILYGTDDTRQLRTLMEAVQNARQDRRAIAFSFLEIVWPAVRGSLRAMRGDVESGLVASIERRAAGEVIADMLGLAKEALSNGSDGAKNVAAVLTAAAYEDTIRKMGATLAGVNGRPDLADVIGALKDARILTGPPLTTALGYLKFRNDSLHADWGRLNIAVVGSCLGFTEGLLAQYFS